MKKEGKDIVVCTSIFQRNLGNIKVRDVLLTIANLSPTFSIFEILQNQEEVRDVLDTPT